MDLSQVLVFMRNSYLLVPILAVVSAILLKTDSLLKDQEVEKEDYLKVMILTAGVVLFMTYVFSLPEPMEEFLTGPANF